MIARTPDKNETINKTNLTENKACKFHLFTLITAKIKMKIRNDLAKISTVLQFKSPSFFFSLKYIYKGKRVLRGSVC